MHGGRTHSDPFGFRGHLRLRQIIRHDGRCGVVLLVSVRTAAWSLEDRMVNAFVGGNMVVDVLFHANEPTRYAV